MIFIFERYDLLVASSAPLLSSTLAAALFYYLRLIFYVDALFYARHRKEHLRLRLVDEVTS